MQVRSLLAVVAATMALGADAALAQNSGAVLGAFADAVTGRGDVARATAVYPDGRFVAVGDVNTDRRYASAIDSGIARYLPDGNRDPSFGVGGARVDSWSTSNDWYESVALQADGKIVALGYMVVPGKGGSGNTGQGIVVRYLASGALDPTFGTGGRAILASGFQPKDIAVQADGKAVVAGPNLDGEIVVARLNVGGTLDSAFGRKGYATFSIGVKTFQFGTGFAASLAIQLDGKIVVGGRANQDIGGVIQRDLCVLRLTASGTLDPSFGSSGVSSIRIPNRSQSPGGPASLLIQPDGKIVFGGSNSSGDWYITLIRLDPEGRLDASFNGTGIQAGLCPGGADGIALTDDGKIVVAGGLEPFGHTVARFLPNGTLDTSFNTDGAMPGYVQQIISLTGDISHGVVYRELDDTIISYGRAYRASDTCATFGFVLIKD